VSSRQVNACSLFCLHKTYLTVIFLFRCVAVILLVVNVGIGGTMYISWGWQAMNVVRLIEP
jgi:hypothetical protein